MRPFVLFALIVALPIAAIAEPQQPPLPGQPLPPVLRGLMPGEPSGCSLQATGPECQARRNTGDRASSMTRRTPNPQYSGRQRRWDDITGSRFVPPKITAFLSDRRIDPATRAFLRGVAAKPTEEWTLQELTTTLQLVPTLTEMHIAAAVLRDFYDFLGLDPSKLFEPQLGNWQKRSIGFDGNSYIATQQAECFYLRGRSENLDPSEVTVRDAAACSDNKAD
jgi:hypothetical protein